MTERRVRTGGTILATCLALASVLLLLDRVELKWVNRIAIPYVDPNDDHWLYRSLDALDAGGQRMGIWGWAAHLWVESGTIPATRESSTEFAFLDWGPQSYYRNRYLRSITQSPPEFFVEAVGPGQFLFEDRRTHGMASLPDLHAFVADNYEEVFDDGSIRLYVLGRHFSECCSWQMGWKDELGTTRRFGSYDSIKAIDSNGWVVSDTADGGGIHSLSMDLPPSQVPMKMLLTFSPGTSPSEGSYSVTVPGAGDCAASLGRSSVMQPALCIIDIPAGPGVQIRVSDMAPQPGGWFAVGRVLLVKTTTH